MKKLNLPPLPYEKIDLFPLMYKVLIIVGISSVFIALFFFLSYKPALEKRTKLDKTITAKQATLDELNKVAARLAEFENEYKNMELTFKKIIQILPDEKEIPELLKNVSNLGTETGLEMTLFKINKESMGEFYAQIPVSIKLKGTYHRIGVFLDKTSKLSRLVNTSNITLKGTKEDEATGLIFIEASMTATTYRYVENPPPPPNQKRKGKRR